MKFKYFVLVIVFSLNAQAQFKTLPLDSVERHLKVNVYQFVCNTLDYCGKHNMPKVSYQESTSSFSKKISPKYLSEICEFYKSIGDVKSIQLMGVFEDSRKLKHYRYKVTLGDYNRYADFRVILSSKNKFHWVQNIANWQSDVFFELNTNDYKKSDITLIDSAVIKRHNAFARSVYTPNDGIYKKYIKPKYIAKPKKVSKWLSDIQIEGDSIFKKNGNIKELALIERLEYQTGYVYYRYKAQFDKLENPSEIRIACNHDERYFGTIVVDVWFNEFYELETALKKSKNILYN